MTPNTNSTISTQPYVSPFTYKYEVTGLKVKDEGSNTSAVVQTYWKITGTDEDGNEGTFSGATPFTSTTMPEGDTFLPFEELTEQIVIGWIQDVVEVNNTGFQNHIDEQIQKQINQKITPIKEVTLPWAPAASANTI